MCGTGLSLCWVRAAWGLFVGAFLENYFCDSPGPRQAPNPHFLEKRVLGSKNPHFPSKKSPFSAREQKTPFSSPCQGGGKWGSWTPKPSFPGNGDSGPVWGQGNRKNNLFPLQVGLRWIFVNLLKWAGKKRVKMWVLGVAQVGQNASKPTCYPL